MTNMAKRLSKEELDIPCRACGETKTVFIYIPPRRDPDHVETVLKQIHRKGWSGDHANRLRCPACTKADKPIPSRVA